MTRKHKLSKDREPTKFIPRFTEHKEESTRNKQDASRTEGDWMRKLGDKAKKIWRTSLPRKRARKLDDRQYVKKDHQYINRSDSGTGPSQTQASDGAGPPANSNGTSREVTRTAQDTEEGQASQPYIGTPLLEQTASSPPAAVEAGLLPKLSSGLLSGSETRHHSTFQQL